MADYGRAALSQLGDLSEKVTRQETSNLFNAKTITEGYLVNTDGTLLASPTYGTTDFIPILGGKLYFCSEVRSIAFYDDNKTFINFSGGAFSYNPPKTNCVIKAHPNAKYVRVSSVLTNLKKNDYRFSFVNVPSKWNNQIWSSLGDSLTQQEMWQRLVADRLGLVHYNFGIGGTKVTDTTGTDTQAMCRDERINALDSRSTLITFMGFTNDWAQNVPLGTLGSTDVSTAYGALNVLYQKLITKFPTARIIAMTPPFQKMPNRAGWADTAGFKNTLNLTVVDYGKVTKEVSAMYGVPVIDLYANAGWCDINIATYVTNDGNYLHPNAEGGKRIAELVAGQLMRIEQIY